MLTEIVAAFIFNLFLFLEIKNANYFFGHHHPNFLKVVVNLVMTTILHNSKNESLTTNKIMETNSANKLGDFEKENYSGNSCL